MIPLILVAVVILLALAAVGYLAYRMLNRSDAVAISDVNEINRAKMEFFAQQKAQYSPADSAVSVNYEATAILKDQIMALEDENSKLRHENMVLKKEKDDLLITKEKLQESAVFIQQLKTNNEALKNVIAEQTRKCNELTESVERITSELDSSNSQGSLGVEIWEQEIADLKAEKEDLLKARAELEQLKQNSAQLEGKEEKIKRLYKRLVKRFVRLRQRMNEHNEDELQSLNRLKDENELFSNRIKSLQRVNEDLEKEVDSLRQKSRKFFGIQSLEEILEQQRVILEQSRQSLEGRTEKVKVLDELESERDRLFAQNKVLQNNYDKLKEMNESLLQKEKILQYELTKSRAHSLGLEKVCEGLTEHIDSLNVI